MSLFCLFFICIGWLLSSHPKKGLIDKISTSTHTDQSVSLLGENITPEEKAVLGGCDWSANEAVVHYDEEVCLSFFSIICRHVESLEDVKTDEMCNSLCQPERRHGLVSVKSRHCKWYWERTLKLFGCQLGIILPLPNRFHLATSPRRVLPPSTPSPCPSILSFLGCIKDAMADTFSLRENAVHSTSMSSNPSPSPNTATSSSLSTPQSYHPLPKHSPDGSTTTRLSLLLFYALNNSSLLSKVSAGYTLLARGRGTGSMKTVGELGWKWRTDQSLGCHFTRGRGR